MLFLRPIVFIATGELHLPVAWVDVVHARVTLVVERPVGDRGSIWGDHPEGFAGYGIALIVQQLDLDPGFLAGILRRVWVVRRPAGSSRFLTGLRGAYLIQCHAGRRSRRPRRDGRRAARRRV